MTKLEEYDQVVHAMQTGVALDISTDDHSVQPKHLRVGINVALVEQSALINLLIKKGIIGSIDEWIDELIPAHQQEVARYEKLLSDRYGREVKLG